MAADPRFLAWRHVRGVPCFVCDGSGVRMYSSTATWRGGMGGSAMTVDVCDRCWGSGDAERSFVNLRKMRDDEERRVAERAVTLLMDRAGSRLGSAREAVLTLAAEIDRLCGGRKSRPEFFRAVAASLAKTLRLGVERGDEERAARAKGGGDG